MSIVVSGAVYLQQVLEMSPLVAGLALLPGVGAAPFAGAFTGHLADRFGARKVTLVALPVTGISLLWIGLAVDWKNYALLVPAFIGWGAATCTLFSAPRKAVFSAVPADKHGETSGILMTSQILGCTMGVAVCGTIYAATHDFRTVFLATAGLTLACFIVGWFCLDRRNADSESEPSRTGADDASLTA
jgi:predicted MFS family arabinose efflux permease